MAHKYSRNWAKRTIKLAVLLLAALGLFLTIIACYLIRTTHVPISILAVATVGVILILNSIVGFLGAKYEKNWALKTFLYISILLTMALAVFGTCATAFQKSFHVWLAHAWTDSTFDYLRQSSCCHTYQETVSYMKYRLVFVGIAGFVAILLLVIGVASSIRLLTIPILMKDMLTIVNFFCLCNGAVILLCGILSIFHGVLIKGYEAIAYASATFGSLLLIVAAVGIAAAKAKNRPWLKVYIVGTTLCSVLLVTIGILVLENARNLEGMYNTSDRGGIACFAQLHGCSNCTSQGIEACPGVVRSYENSTGEGIWHNCEGSEKDCLPGKTARNQIGVNSISACGQCPEWTSEDLATYFESGLKLTGLALILTSIFVLVGLCGAIVFHRSLQHYRTDII